MRQVRGGEADHGASAVGWWGDGEEMVGEGKAKALTAKCRDKRRSSSEVRRKRASQICDNDVRE